MSGSDVADLAERATCVDFHSHLVPGVDDGAGHIDQSLRALNELRQARVRRVITTPHLSASVAARPAALERNLATVDMAFAALVQSAREQLPGTELLLGREVLLDTPSFDASDPRVRLGGGPFVLVEFPLFGIPPGSADALFALKARGYYPIVAHPERYHGIERQQDVVSGWRRVGALLQVNARSLIGGYGSDARRVALDLIARGWADYIASDYHARGHPRLNEAREVLVARGGAEQAELLFGTNPRRLLAGELPLSPPPLSGTPSGWKRWLARLRGSRVSGVRPEERGAVPADPPAGGSRRSAARTPRR